MSVTDSIAKQFGISHGTREKAVRDLYLATEHNPLTYWAQLLIAAGIAHLGLVLNSTAVVIGAMLVSPLMTPIVQVGMGFTVGNSYLTAKATGRILISMLITVAFAALMTKVMPYEAVTNEILSRTQPTALDLFVALFCGLAAAFTNARGGKDTVTAAAGTAIAIALVPPLCVVGFGVGVASGSIVWGATLLFTANLAAIILISDVFFLVTGFADIDVQAMEEHVLTERDLASPLYSFTRKFKFSSTIQRRRTFRVALPVLFVITVLFPLAKALSRVAWEVDVKKKVNQAVERFEKSHQVLNKRVAVAYKSVGVRLMVAGEPGDVKEMEKSLAVDLAAAAGVQPDVGIDVVPSTDFMNERFRLSADWLTKEIASMKMYRDSPANDNIALSQDSKVRSLSASILQSRLREFFSSEIESLSKADTMGKWLSWSLILTEKGAGIEIKRLADQDLPSSFRAVVGRVLEDKTQISVNVTEKRIPELLYSTRISRVNRIPVATLKARLEEIADETLLGVRLTMPPEDRRTRPMNQALTGLVKTAIPDDRLVTETGGNSWSVGVFSLKSSQSKAGADSTLVLSDSAPAEPLAITR